LGTGSAQKSTVFVRPATGILPDIAVFMVMLIINLTQHVIAPYDILSCFLFILAVYLIIRVDSAAGFFGLCCAVILATLTRETSILILVFYMAYFHRDLDLSRVRTNPGRLIHLLVICTCFIIPYFLLRAGLGFHNAYFENTRFLSNLGFPE
jgi:hypothetical protein